MSWSDHKGARTSCDECLRNIAKGEQQHFSDPARMVRTTMKGKEFFCSRHGSAKKVEDDLAGLTRKK